MRKAASATARSSRTTPTPSARSTSTAGCAANPAAEALVGYAADDLVGEPFWTLVNPGARASAREFFHAAARGEPQFTETAFTHTSGTRVEVSLRLLPIVVDAQ